MTAVNHTLSMTRLATLRVGGSNRAARSVAGGAWQLLEAADVGTAGTTAAAGDPAEVVDFAPLVPHPRKVICCGHNYRAHIREMGRELPEHPTLFTKFADSLAGAYDDVVVTRQAAEAGLDWEAELLVVVGTPIRRGATAAEASTAIAGYSVANDLSVRGWQRRTTQWLPGKALDAATPVGPWMVPADEIDPAAGLRLSCTVNGEVVQDASTADLVFDAPTLLAAIAEFTTLSAGDLVLTGTPGGVGAAMEPPCYLGDGDVVEAAVEGIGSTHTTILIKEET